MLSLFVLGNFIFSLIGTWLSIFLAKKYQIVDNPALNPDKKKHLESIPLIGFTGATISSLFFWGLFWVFYKYEIFIDGDYFGANLHTFRLGWIFVAILILLVGGFLDDKYNLPAKYMFIPINLALLVAIFLGELRIETLSYPFYSFLENKEWLQILITYLWLGSCLAATKFLDGMDGLVTSSGIIATVAIALVSLQPQVNQPVILAFCLIWLSGLFGFLPFNLPNAKVYLGEGGSEIIGFVIGVLSILSGAKVATASTVIGWFIYDIILVMLFRLIRGKNPLTTWDRNHWHHRLLKLGFTKTQALIVTVIILSLTAFVGVILPTEDKVLVLVGQGIFLTILFILSLLWEAKKSKKESV
jgi:UDP-GlcNAc:undecaprenyl-phosphate/decaprenyl-phosphate GlcNAc-1-phosphate transferase